MVSITPKRLGALLAASMFVATPAAFANSGQQMCGCSSSHSQAPAVNNQRTNSFVRGNLGSGKFGNEAVIRSAHSRNNQSIDTTVAHSAHHMTSFNSAQFEGRSRSGFATNDQSIKTHVGGNLGSGDFTNYATGATSNRQKQTLSVNHNAGRIDSENVAKLQGSPARPGSSTGKSDQSISASVGGNLGSGNFLNTEKGASSNRQSITVTVGGNAKDITAINSAVVGGGPR